MVGRFFGGIRCGLLIGLIAKIRSINVDLAVTYPRYIYPIIPLLVNNSGILN